MAEEFQESDVVFQENEGSEDNEDYDFPEQLLNARAELRRNSKPRRKKLRTKETINSVPMNISENVSGNPGFQYFDSDFLEDNDADDGELVPPHVIIGRRIAAKTMAFSVCTGNGRTLKGRDLSEVRNSILRLTGFLET